MKTIKKTNTATNLETNPFEIKTNINLTGSRTGANTRYIPLLEEQVLKLKAGDKTSSIHIPVTLFPTKAEASNLILGLRRKLKEKKATENIYLVSRTLYDAKNNYIGVRIWRMQ